MDALEFLKERKRMCDSYTGCKGCPFDDSRCVIDSTLSDDDDCERIIVAVEKWSKEHPRKTRQSAFLEQYPEAALDKDGYPVLNPCGFYKKMREECIGKLCHDCRQEFWMQEVD